MNAFLGVTPTELYKFTCIFKKELLWIEKRIVTLSSLDILMIVLLRLRLYLPLRAMCCLVNRTPSTCWRVIELGLKILGRKAEQKIHLPNGQIRLNRGKNLTIINSDGTSNEIRVTWLIDGWNQTIYQYGHSDIKRVTYSAKVSKNVIKK